MQNMNLFGKSVAFRQCDDAEDFANSEPSSETFEPARYVGPPNTADRRSRDWQHPLHPIEYRNTKPLRPKSSLTKDRLDKEIPNLEENGKNTKTQAWKLPQSLTSSLIDHNLMSEYKADDKLKYENRNPLL